MAEVRIRKRTMEFDAGTLSLSVEAKPTPARNWKRNHQLTPSGRLGTTISIERRLQLPHRTRFLDSDLAISMNQTFRRLSLRFFGYKNDLEGYGVGFVDDGSGDNSLEILKTFRGSTERDQEVRLQGTSGR